MLFSKKIYVNFLIILTITILTNNYEKTAAGILSRTPLVRTAAMMSTSIFHASQHLSALPRDQAKKLETALNDMHPQLGGGNAIKRLNLALETWTSSSTLSNILYTGTPSPGRTEIQVAIAQLYQEIIIEGLRTARSVGLGIAPAVVYRGTKMRSLLKLAGKEELKIHDQFTLHNLISTTGEVLSWESAEHYMEMAYFMDDMNMEREPSSIYQIYPTLSDSNVILKIKKCADHRITNIIDIKDFSVLKLENEALILPGAKFTVMSITPRNISHDMFPYLFRRLSRLSGHQESNVVVHEIMLEEICEDAALLTAQKQQRYDQELELEAEDLNKLAKGTPAETKRVLEEAGPVPISELFSIRPPS